MKDAKKAGQSFEQLVDILDTLRGYQGCPWDREQDEVSITNFFLEEVYEAVDALISGDDQSLAEELGDVLMEVVFLARIFKEKKRFMISDVVEGVNQKMIRRHPHVFGQKPIKTSSKVLDEWNKQKKTEKKRGSFFEGMARHSPALLTSYQIGVRVSSVGFDWERVQDVIQKMREELGELEKAIRLKNQDDMLLEVGDVFFCLANLARHLGINPELALKQSNDKFIERFHLLEKELEKKGKKLGKVSLEEMDQIWNEIKQ